MLPVEPINDDPRTVRERISSMPQFESYDTYCNLIRSTGAVYRARALPCRNPDRCRAPDQLTDPPACPNVDFQVLTSAVPPPRPPRVRSFGGGGPRGSLGRPF